MGLAVMLRDKAYRDSAPSLSNRQIEVLRLVVRGMSNPEIAEKLEVSVETVKTHLKSILAKLGASSRTAAVVKAMEAGLVKERSKGKINQDDFIQNLGRVIVIQRKAQGLSQAELADRSQLRRTTVSNLENGRHNPTLGTLFAIISVLDMDIVELVEKARNIERPRRPRKKRN